MSDSKGNLIPTDALATWGSTVSQSPLYQAASDQEKADAVHAYFQENIAPSIPKDKLDAAQKQWAFSVVPQQEFYTNPEFLKLESKDKLAVFRNNLIANGKAPAEVDSGGQMNLNPAGSAAGDFSIPTNDQPSLVDQAYKQWENDPNVSSLRHEAYGKSVGAPFAAISQTRAAITGEKDTAEAANAYINRKNELQSYFPETQAAELAASAIPAMAGGEVVSALSKVPTGAGLWAKGASFLGNTIGNAGVAAAVNPEQVSAGGDQVSKLRGAKEDTADINAGVTAIANSLVPGWMGAKKLVSGFSDSSAALMDNIDHAANKVAKFLGISKQEALESLAADANKASSGEGTLAGIQGSNTPTSQNSTLIAKQVVNPTSDLDVQSQVRSNQYNAEAQKIVEGSSKYGNDLKKGAAPILPAQSMPEGTTLDEAQAALAPKKLAPGAYSVSDPMARNTVVGDYQTVASAINDAKYPNSKLPINDSVGQKALDDSPTVQAIREEASKAGVQETGQELSPEYEAAKKQFGEQTADNLVQKGQLKQYATTANPAAAEGNTSLTAETLQDHIDGISNEIDTAGQAGNTKQAAALIGVKKELQGIQKATYAANPGLEEAVTNSINAVKTDKALSWFDQAVPMLEGTNSVGEAGKLSKNLDVKQVDAFLKANATPEAVAERQKLMSNNPKLLEASNALVETVQKIQREMQTAPNTGSDTASAAAAGAKAVFKQTLGLKTGALSSAMEAVKRATNGAYMDALTQFSKNGGEAAKAIDATIARDSKNVDFKQMYNSIVRPAINGSSTLSGNAISDSNDDKKVKSTAVPVDGTGPLQSTPSPTILNIDKDAQQLTPAQTQPLPPVNLPNWLNYQPS